MKTVKTGMILVLATALATTTANAAILQDIQGDVRVGRDKGFVRVEGSTEVLPGDKIKVGRKAAANLVYADGCSVPVDANSLSRVAEHSPCSFKALAVDNSAPVYVPLDSGIPCDPFAEWERWAPCLLGLGLAGTAAGVAATWPSSPQTAFFFVPPSPATP